MHVQRQHGGDDSQEKGGRPVADRGLGTRLLPPQSVAQGAASTRPGLRPARGVQSSLQGTLFLDA